MAINFKQLVRDMGRGEWTSWRDAFVAFAPKAIECALRGGNWTDWDPEVLNSFLSNNKGNPIASIGMPQGRFSGQEVEVLKANWSEIAPILKDIASNQTELREELYSKLINKIEPLCTMRRFSAMHRMIVALQPGLLTSIVNRNDLYSLCSLINKYTDEQTSFTGTYFQISHKVYNLIKEASGEEWQFIPTLAWEIYDYLKGYQPAHEAIESKNSEIIKLIKENSQIILQGAPGTGKTYRTCELALMLCDAPKETFATRESMEEEFDRLMDSGRIFFTTFHQSMDYEDFVEGFKPSLEGGSMGYELEKGIFRRACDAAAAKPDQNFVLIIDEINRGNISKIFGELITLLEHDKRGGRLSATLPYSKDKFTVPTNLYVIGTMNTSDRSTGTVDYALRRRLAFHTLEADRRIVETFNFNTEEARKSALNYFDKVADYLEATATDDIQDLMVGHSYFLARDAEALERKWNYSVLPLLDEYYRDGITSLSFEKWQITPKQ